MSHVVQELDDVLDEWNIIQLTLLKSLHEQTKGPEYGTVCS